MYHIGFGLYKYMISGRYVGDILLTMQKNSEIDADESQQYK